MVEFGELPVETSVKSAYPVCRGAIPAGSLRAGRYSLRFAQSLADLKSVQRLRFEVFNLELDEGLDSAYATGLDEDDLDESCHHLMVIHHQSGEVVGTYRLMIEPMASARGGFYSETEYSFNAATAEMKSWGVEVGRACVAKPHRNGRVIHLLWRGLARYLSWNDKRFLFGCCSVATLDPTIGERMYADLRRDGHLHPNIALEPLPALRVPAETVASEDAIARPPLFESYLALGAQVCSRPAIDRAFKVIDFLVLLDVEQMDPRVRHSFMNQTRWEADS